MCKHNANHTFLQGSFFLTKKVSCASLLSLPMNEVRATYEVVISILKEKKKKEN